MGWRCGLTSAIQCLLRLLHGDWPPSSSIHPWLLRLKQHLEKECPDPRTRLRYLRGRREFLAYLEAKGLPLEKVEPQHVGAYCELTLRTYRKRHGRLSGDLHRWRVGVRVPIHRLLRLAQLTLDEPRDICWQGGLWRDRLFTQIGEESPAYLQVAPDGFCTKIATDRGRSGLKWAILGLFLGPFALLFALMLPKVSPSDFPSMNLGASSDARESESKPSDQEKNSK